jgi:hypothetical protein
VTSHPRFPATVCRAAHPSVYNSLFWSHPSILLPLYIHPINSSPFIHTTLVSLPCLSPHTSSLQATTTTPAIMHITTSVLAVFVATGVATSGTPAPEPDSNKAYDGKHPFESAPIDGNWRIGCDQSNHCSYYHGPAASTTGIAALRSTHTNGSTMMNGTARAARSADFPKINITSAAVALNMVSSFLQPFQCSIFSLHRCRPSMNDSLTHFRMMTVWPNVARMYLFPPIPTRSSVAMLPSWETSVWTATQQNARYVMVSHPPLRILVLIFHIVGMPQRLCRVPTFQVR